MTGYLRQTLKQLFIDIPVKVISPQELPEIPITGICFDSRAVQPGYLFVALVGGKSDGHRYLPDAVVRGAAAIVGTRSDITLDIPYICVNDTRVALAHLSAAFYRFPARKLTVIGVTGTDGKTTTSNLIYQILLSAGLRAGIISTVNAIIGDEVVDTGFHVTTPEAPDVQLYLSRMLAAGLTHVVLESTSHGLDQERVTGSEFDIGVVTNITHEHLDYHGSYDAYRDAKAKLFRMLAETHPKAHGNPRLAILNHDDRSYDYLHQITTVNQISYSVNRNGNGDFYAEDVRYDPAGLRFVAVADNMRIPVESHLVGTYNVSNCLAAIATATRGLGIPAAVAGKGIASMRGVPGRMEQITLGQNFIAIVDFAHTPNALRRTLETARELTSGRVIAIFGSAGLRDRQKRSLMAEVSAELADLTILTAEDPRTESLDDILAEMADSAKRSGGSEGQTYWRIADRGKAIRTAISMAKPGDVVIACGKGHEQSMCFGETEYSWDDRIAMRSALSDLLGIAGPKMPYLPT